MKSPTIDLSIRISHEVMQHLGYRIPEDHTEWLNINQLVHRSILIQFGALTDMYEMSIGNIIEYEMSSVWWVYFVPGYRLQKFVYGHFFKKAQRKHREYCQFLALRDELEATGKLKRRSSRRS